MNRFPVVIQAFLISLIASSSFYPQEKRKDPTPEDFRAVADCGQCHVRITEEWSNSAHNRAGQAEILSLLQSFDAELAARMRPYYLPTLLHRARGISAPAVRKAFAERGVDCIACHMDEGYQMHGPQGLNAPHKVVRDLAFESAEVCIPCHGQKDEMDQATAWRESGLEDGMVYCQSCHMPEIRGKLVQHWALGELPERTGHNHQVRGPSDLDFLRSGVTLGLTLQEGEAVVKLSAGIIGHQFPGIGYRQAVLITRAFTSNGTLLWEATERIDHLRHENTLRPGETRTFRYPDQGAPRIESTLLYKEFLEQDDSKGVLIQQARNW